jgi:molybdenum cofactor cytidylyltransferase
VRALRINGKSVRDTDVVGRVLTHDIGPNLRKGTVIGPEHVERLRQVDEFHVAELEATDVHEDEAAKRLARAICGPGLEASGPVQSQMRLLAAQRGLVRVEGAAVDRLNRLGPVSVFTLVDGQAVDAATEVAGCKVTPVAVPAAVIAEAEAIARAQAPVVRVDAFRPLRTLIVVTERLKPKARELFLNAVQKKLGWYGAQVEAVREVPRSPDAVRQSYAEALATDMELVIFAGASSIDPLDAAYEELAAVGGEVVQQGAPSHPGSMLWLGRLDRAVVLGVASCAGFGKSTSLDLLLPFVFAYGRADAEDIRRLGVGGLIEAGAGRTFPPYG